jgi:hypothetical protein
MPIDRRIARRFVNAGQEPRVQNSHLSVDRSRREWVPATVDALAVFCRELRHLCPLGLSAPGLSGSENLSPTSQKDFCNNIGLVKAASDEREAESRYEPLRPDAKAGRRSFQAWSTCGRRRKASFIDRGDEGAQLIEIDSVERSLAPGYCRQGSSRRHPQQPITGAQISTRQASLCPALSRLP